MGFLRVEAKTGFSKSGKKYGFSRFVSGFIRVKYGFFRGPHGLGHLEIYSCSQKSNKHLLRPTNSKKIAPKSTNP